MRVAPNKLPEQTLIDRCNELNLEYIKSSTKDGKTYVDFLCKRHADRGEQRSSWSHLRTATYGCAYCSGKHKTSSELQRELDEKNVPVTILGEYVSARTKIDYRCSLCGKVFSAIPNSLLNRQACPECGLVRRSDKRRKSADTFIKELEEIQPNIEIIGEYIGSHKPIQCRCKLDDCHWESYPVNLLNLSAGCPMCKNRISHGENAIMNYLDKNDIYYKREFSFDDCRRIHKLRFGFYIPDLNTAIEFDGRQHFEDIPRFNHLHITQERDKLKDEYCMSNNIKLIRIPFYDINNIEYILNKELKNTA